MINLLDKLKILEYKYEKLKELDTFNIFTILLNANDEVNLHSQFLYHLLNPNASHKKGADFLRKFIEICAIGDYKMDNLVVHKEYKKIDILIKNKQQAIIIENKIGAPDQDKQLERYYSILEKENVEDIKLIYLSLDGKEPSDRSLGNLKSKPNIEQILFQISYKYHIKTWIDECIKLSALHSSLRETLNQYQNLISELTGATMNKQEYLEIIELLAQNDNIIQAHKIATNWNHVKWHTEWDFWCDLEKIISQEYEILDENKFSSELLDRAIHYTRNRNLYYGMRFVIKVQNNYKYSICVERSEGDLYYGLIILDKENKIVKCEDKLFDDLAKKIENFAQWERTEYWIGGNYFEPRINFEAFGNITTLKILNKEFRNQYINENWANIKIFIAACMKII